MKTKGQLIATEKECTLRVIIGDFNKSQGKYVKTWVMYSLYTGTHSINTFTNQPDNRVVEHWKGFLANQPN